MRDLTQPPSIVPEPSRVIHFSVDGVPERERPEVYREFFGRAVMRVDVEPLRDVPFVADLKLRALPGLQLAAGSIQGARNRRTSALAADGIDDVALIINIKGPYLLTHQGQELLLGDGDATVFSCEEGGSVMHHPPGDVFGLRIPRARFAALVPAAGDCFLQRIPRDSQALRLLRNYLDIAWDEHSLAGHEVQRLFAAHVYDLVAATVGATADAGEVARTRGLHAARLHAIKRDIAKNLDRPDLSVTALARRHGLKPRYIQRLFETEGTTFTEYVLGQRLARAYRLLIDPRRERDKISAVACDAGFNDLSYFNRAFRRRFSAAPSDIREQARRSYPAS